MWGDTNIDSRGANNQPVVREHVRVPTDVLIKSIVLAVSTAIKTAMCKLRLIARYLSVKCAFNTFWARVQFSNDMSMTNEKHFFYFANPSWF